LPVCLFNRLSVYDALGLWQNDARLYDRIDYSLGDIRFIHKFEMVYSERRRYKKVD